MRKCALEMSKDRLTAYIRRSSLLPFFFFTVAFIESVWILRSHGFYYIDEGAHYLYSRFVLKSLATTVETWHRPGRLWLFALPAQFGHTVTMFFSLAIFLLVLYFTYRIAVLKKIKHAEWVVLFTGLQPVLFDISYACLAEAPAALVIVISYWLHLKGERGWSLLIASLVFLFRFEMYAFALLLFILHTGKKEWRLLPLVLVGPALWIGSSAFISGDVFSFFKEWTHFSDLGKFIPGVPVTHYLEHMQTIFGFLQVACFCLGVMFITRARRHSDFAILYATIALCIIVNTLAGAEIFHWTASIGELRYIAVVGPFVGIISVYGFSEMLEKVRPSRMRILFASLAFVILVVNCIATTHPRRWAPYDQLVIEMTHEARTKYEHLTILSNNWVVPYVMDVPPTGGDLYAKLNKSTLAHFQECLILWDPFYSQSLFSQTELSKEEMLQEDGVEVLEKRLYGNAEYLLLYRHNRKIALAE